MKQNIHPAYHTKAKITCSGCDTIYEVGSVTDKMSTEVCGNCHPFYTGKHRLVDSTGRVERFNKKYAKFLNPAEAEKKEVSEKEVEVSEKASSPKKTSKKKETEEK